MTTSADIATEDRLGLEVVLDVIERERRNAEYRRSDEVADALRVAADELAGRFGLGHHLAAERARDEHLRRGSGRGARS